MICLDSWTLTIHVTGIGSELCMYILYIIKNHLTYYKNMSHTRTTHNKQKYFLVKSWRNDDYIIMKIDQSERFAITCR